MVTPATTELSVIAPPVAAGGIGRYTETLCDRLDAAGARSERWPIGDGRGPIAAAVAAFKAIREADVLVQFEYGFFRPKLLVWWTFLVPLVVGRLVWERQIVVTMHEVWTPETVGRFQFLYISVVHFTIAATATDIVFMTPESEADFRAGISTTTHQIPHGVPVDDSRDISQETARETFGYDEMDTVVAQIGYISKRKGTETVVELANQRPEMELLIAGGARRSEDQPYVDQIKAISGQNVQITGVLDETAFHHAFVAADVVVLAYRDIRQSGILNWCFAYGVPVVCRSIPRFRSVASECSGVVLFDGGPKALGEKIDIAVEARDKLSRAIEAYANQHDFDNVAKSYLNIMGSKTSSDDSASRQV